MEGGERNGEFCDFNRVTVLGYEKMKEDAGVKLKGNCWSGGEGARGPDEHCHSS